MKRITPVISDNTKQFKTADNILKYIFDQPRVQQFLANNNIIDVCEKP